MAQKSKGRIEEEAARKAAKVLIEHIASFSSKDHAWRRTISGLDWSHWDARSSSSNRAI
jgi:hypothetical protein